MTKVKSLSELNIQITDSYTTYENTVGGSTKLLYNDTSVNDYVVELPKKNAVLASTNEANFSYKPTPVTITSWSYVTTTITLNVASHTFVAGDYIEVGGLTATTNIPNGVHLVTSVTTTTIVFTYALTPTGTAGVSSATVKGYMTTNGRTNGIGEGQTWQNVTGSRTATTVYTNTTGNPIVASISTIESRDGFGTIVSISVGGVIIASAQAHRVSAASPGEAFVTAIIPNASTFSYNWESGVDIVTRIMELR